MPARSIVAAKSETNRYIVNQIAKRGAKVRHTARPSDDVENAITAYGELRRQTGREHGIKFAFLCQEYWPGIDQESCRILRSRFSSCSELREYVAHCGKNLNLILFLIGVIECSESGKKPSPKLQRVLAEVFGTRR